MSTSHYSIIPLLIAAFAGATATYSVLKFTSNDTAQRQQISLLENRILDLEVLLIQKEEALKNSRVFAADALESTPGIAHQSALDLPKLPESQAPVHDSSDQAAATPNVDQMLKDLMTLAYGDPRTFSEKINDFLAENPDKENIAIASKSIFDLADNQDVLPDRSLESIYLDQTDPDLKRVVAQVASLRGDNRLIDMQLTEMQKDLKSTSASDRQKALVELGKTRYVGAANLVVPLLQDRDTGVKLDALLALRATGNQSHIRFVEHLVNHPDESVSWLAKDVVSQLQMLSDVARTKIAGSDIVAELPPITMQ